MQSIEIHNLTIVVPVYNYIFTSTINVSYRFNLVGSLQMKGHISLLLLICNKQLGGDLIPWEKQWRCYQYLFDIIHCNHEGSICLAEGSSTGFIQHIESHVSNY